MASPSLYHKVAEERNALAKRVEELEEKLRPLAKAHDPHKDWCEGVEVSNVHAQEAKAALEDK